MTGRQGTTDKRIAAMLPEIQEALKMPGLTVAEVARRFNISPRTAKKIKEGRIVR